LFALNNLTAEQTSPLPADPRTTLASLAACAVICLALPTGLQLVGRFKPTIDWETRARRAPHRAPRPAWSPNTFWALLTAFLFAAAFLHLSRPSEFIYWQF